MLVELEGQLGIEFPVSEFDRAEWNTPAKSLRKSTRCKADDEKRLLTAFGPLLCVGILVGGTLPWPLGRSIATIRKSSLKRRRQ